jgi:uncharacterized protein
MAQEDTIKIVQQYLKAVPKKYVIKSAFLFGSFARNNQHADSDIDVAIVIEGRKITSQVDLDFMIARRKIDLRIEPHAISSKQFDKYNPMVAEILKYGIPIKLK